jgi:hypothetical protein
MDNLSQKKVNLVYLNTLYLEIYKELQKIMFFQFFKIFK